MKNQQPKRKSLLLHRLAMVAVALVCLAAIKMLLGTRTLMYLYARDIDHIAVTVTPPGESLTATGDDVAEAVSLLSKAVTHGRQNEAPAGQAVSLTIYNHDGTTQQVVACGDYLEIDGKGYKMRLSDGEKIDAWADALAEKQGIALE